MSIEKAEERSLAYLSDAAIPSRDANSIQTMSMCDAFADIGLEVTLFVPDRGQTSSDPFQFYDVDRSFEIVRIPWRPGERYQYSALAPMYVSSYHPDFVYGRFLPACFGCAMLGYPVVLESHTPETTHWSFPWMLKTLILFGRLEKLVTISDALKEFYCSEYALSSSSVLVAHDAAHDISNADPIQLAQTGRLQVGYTGHLYKGKGISLIRELVELCDWADFHIIGGTEQDIEMWKRRFENCSNVVFHGFVSPREVQRYQTAMDVLLAPYQREVYGSSGAVDLSEWMSPLKLIEYMAAEKPIICSDMPVLREIITDGQTGLLCDPADVDCWKRSLEKLADNQELRTRLSENAYRHYQRNFTFRSRAERILHAIE